MDCFASRAMTAGDRGPNDFGRHCEEPTGRAKARPMTGSATKQSISPQKESKKDGLLRFARNDGARNDGGRPGGQMTLAVIARSEATKQSISPQKESKKDGLLRFARNDGGRPGSQMTLAVIARSVATKQSISPQKESKKDE